MTVDSPIRPPDAAPAHAGDLPHRLNVHRLPAAPGTPRAPTLLLGHG